LLVIDPDNMPEFRISIERKIIENIKDLNDYQTKFKITTIVQQFDSNDQLVYKKERSLEEFY
jgi:hypothetical protein